MRKGQKGNFELVSVGVVYDTVQRDSNLRCAWKMLAKSSKTRKMHKISRIIIQNIAMYNLIRHNI